jgi:hypothetical protein
MFDMLPAASWRLLSEAYLSQRWRCLGPSAPITFLRLFAGASPLLFIVGGLSFLWATTAECAIAIRSRVATSARSFSTSATTLPLPLFRVTSLRACAGAAPFLFVLGEHLCSLGGHLEVLSLTTSIRHKRPFFSGKGRGHPHLSSLPPPLSILVLADTL